MADIALVHLGIDSSGVTAGEKQIAQSLKHLETALASLEKAITGLGNKFDSNLKPKLEDSGKAAKQASASFAGMGGALSGLGGPLGRVASEVSNLGGQIQGLIGSFGLFGAAFVGVGAAAAAAGAAIVKFALDGVRLSDELADIAEGLGFTEDQMERLNAATRLSGEQIGFLERTFGTFQQAVQTALIDKTGAAANALRRLGIEAPQAARDTQAAFLELLPKMSGVTQSFGQMTAARELFGRGLGPLIRVSQNFAEVMGLTRGEMVAMGLAVDESTNKMAGAVDRRFNEILLIWDNLKRNLILEVGPTFLQLGQDMVDGLRKSLPQIAEFFKLVAEQFQAAARGKDLFDKAVAAGRGAAEGEKAGLRGIIGQTGTPGFAREVERGFTGERFLQGLPSLTAAIDRVTKAGGGPLPSNAAQGGIRSGFGLGQPFTLQGLSDSVAKGVKTGITALPEQFKAGKAGQAARPITEFTPEQIGDPLKHWAAARQRDAQDAEAAWEAVQIRRSNVTTEWLELLRILSSGVEQLVPPSGSPIQQGVAGQPFPGAPIFGGLPHPDTIRTEEQARLDEQFTAIFDDMLISILTAQKTLGEAFGGLAIGIVDTFAAEFTKSLHKEFITPMVQELTNLLQSALKDLFGGLSAGGVKGFFGGLVKGIGTIFGGFFASGGTLGPGKFGVAGERGPELIFSGSQPMHIAPVTAGSAGNVFNISVGVNAPSGTVDKRTQDQLAATVMNAVKRAQRNEGAR